MKWERLNENRLLAVFLWAGTPMDEEEYTEYLKQVFDIEDISEEDGLHEQLWNEHGRVPGCYRVLPAKVE